MKEQYRVVVFFWLRVHRAVDNKMSNFESKLGKYVFEFLHTKNESMLRNYVDLIHSRVERTTRAFTKYRFHKNRLVHKIN